MKKLMNSKKFEEYKSNEVAAAWAVLGGEPWRDTLYVNKNGVTCNDVADRGTFDEETNRYLQGDVTLYGEKNPPCNCGR